ncbi:MAG: DEAD/DEAH box helicase [Actinomycetota bacterium]
MSEVQRRFVEGLNFAVDDFQLRAFSSLDAGNSVLVSAPTGSGKTLIAEYALEIAIQRDERAFYTTPIKALSNQKYRDLVERLGGERVGLLTGDNSINPGADVVVMTTEVLRNMIYARSSSLASLGVVVLDEVHFLQDTFRGPVWEEVIIHLPMEVQLVCLSATVSNAAEVAAWLTTVRGRTDSIVESTRPVELVNHFVVGDTATHSLLMHDTLVHGEPNQRLRRLLVEDHRRRGQQYGAKNRRSRFFIPNRVELVELLDDEDMLPAIIFIFSRAQCDDAVRSCDRAGLRLTDRDESLAIRDIVERRCVDLTTADKQVLGYDDFVHNICNGIASHHAGMIPLFKEAVEECFVAGLVKVVFATETLAVGINMPARAVVIEKLTKFSGEHHTPLRATDFAQLTGRAGRRGIDAIGHAITLWSPQMSYDQVVSLATSRAFSLNSAFRPTFNMAVNLVSSHSRVEASHLLSLSFAQFQADKEIVAVEAQLQAKRRELALLRRDEEEPDSQLEECAESPVKDLQEHHVASPVEVEIALRGFRPGDVFLVDSVKLRGKAVVLSTASRRSGQRLTVITTSRKILDLVAADFDAVPMKGGVIDLPVPFDPSRTDFQREAASRLSRVEPSPQSFVRRVRGISITDDESSRDRRARKLRADIDKISKRSQTQKGAVVARFDGVVAILEELGYVTNWSLTDKGRLLTRVFHESDLLVTEVLSQGLLVGLSVGDLAGVLSCITYDPRGRPEESTSWMNDTVRSRYKRIDKLSKKIQALELQHGMASHRAPDGGLHREVAAWSKGAALSRILDPEITPGDFVRHVRQVIDLARQISTVSTDATLAEVASDLATALDRGLVAASTAVAVESGPS